MPASGKAVDHVALAALFLEEFVTGMIGNCRGNCSQSCRGHVIGNRGERRDEIRHVVELFGLERGVFLPFGHAVELGDFAEVCR